MQRQTSKRGQVKIAQLNEQLEILKKAEATASASLLKDSQNAQFAIASLRKANTGLQNELSTLVTRWALQLEKTRIKLENSKFRCSKLQKEVTALRKFKSRSQIVKEQAIARVKGKLLQERSAHHLGITMGYPRVLCVSDLVGLLPRIFLNFRAKNHPVPLRID